MGWLKKAVSAFICLSLWIGHTAHFSAEGPPFVAEVQSGGNNEAHLFLGDVGDSIDSVTCQIGQELCPAADFGGLADAGIPVDTVFAIDVSTSILPAQQQAILELMDNMIARKPGQDCYSIVTIGETVQTVIGFSADRWELGEAMKQIVFDHRQSNLYLGVQTILRSLGEQPPEAVAFRQIVVLSDGVEQSEEGIIKEELFFELKENPYPIHTISCRNSGNAEALKELAALSRISNAGNFTLEEDTDQLALAEGLSALRDSTFWVKVELPDSVQDGSQKQCALTLTNSRGESMVVRHAMTMPLLALSPDDSPGDAEDAAEETDDEQSSEEEAQDAGDANALQRFARLPWILFIVLAVVLVAAVVLIVVFLSKRKSSKQSSQAVLPDVPVTPASVKDETQILGSSGHTRLLIEQGAVPGYPRLVLIDIKQTNRRFESVLSAPVLLGRDNQKCQMVIDYDKSISRQHCRIYLDSGKLWVQDLGSANKTYVNDVVIAKPHILQERDVLRLGKVRFHVSVS